MAPTQGPAVLRLSNNLWRVFIGSIVVAIIVGYVGLRTPVDIEWVIIAVFAVAIVGLLAMAVSVSIAQRFELRVLRRAVRINRRRYRLLLIEELARCIIPILVGALMIATMIYGIARLIARVT